MKETGEEEFNVCLLFGDQHERGQFDSIGWGVPTPEGLWIHISIDAFTTADKSNTLCTFNCQKDFSQGTFESECVPLKAPGPIGEQPAQARFVWGLRQFFISWGE